MSTRILADRFELQKQLSQTDVSSVYLGCDRQQLQRSSCVITAIYYSQPTMRHRLEREARVIEQLGHSPQVPSVLSYFYRSAGQEMGGLSGEKAGQEIGKQTGEKASPARNTFFIVQKHVLGHPLSKEITPGKKLSESYVTKLLQDILVALCSIHRQGQVHQNLHPQNLIRQDFDGQLFLTDFGSLSRLSRSELNADGTLTVTMPVSPHPYLAPEQLQPDYTAQPLPASDLYSLGLIAIEALTGQPHYDFAYDTMKGLLWREGTEVSLFLAEFIDRLVRHKAEDRFADAPAALETLQIGRDRHNIANDSRLNTVIAAPGGAAKVLPTTGRTLFGRGQSGSQAGNQTGNQTGSQTGSGAGRTLFGGKQSRPPLSSTTGSTTGNTYPFKSANPHLFKIFTGGIALVIALGVGVKTFQWGEYRLAQLPQTWEDWRTSRISYPEAKPNELTPLLRDRSILLRPAAAQSFWEMVAAAKEDNVNLYALAGYRAQDATLAVETAQNDYPTGYAIAIGGEEESQDWQPSFAQSEAFGWLSRNAANYGFELSVVEKGLLGSTSTEPWHWRYVGDSQSKDLFKSSARSTP